jgi:predicted Zn-dependent protease
MKYAFDYWSDVTPLKFTEVCSACSADFSIVFAEYHHKHYGNVDCNSFDGQGGVLAHAYYPSDGSIHFDESEEFTENTRDGINLRIVAAHEIGHAIGIAHSFDQTALMYPFYMGYHDYSFKLPQDDVNGVQSLYGKRMSNPRPPPRPSPSRPPQPPPRKTTKKPNSRY